MEMKTNKKTVAAVTAESEEERIRNERNAYYLRMIYTMSKQSEHFAFSKLKGTFNNSEMRLLGEIVDADVNGVKVISTQLAKRLGVTRSAVSQMVNKLESKGVVKRVCAEGDKKIAYVELSDSAIRAYEEQKSNCRDFVGEVIDRFGEDNFDALLQLIDDFVKTCAAV